MLDDLAVAVETEDVDPGVVVVVRPCLVVVQHDVVVFGHGTLDLDSFAWVPAAIRSKYAAASKHSIRADRPVLSNVPAPVAVDEARAVGAGGGLGQAP